MQQNRGDCVPKNCTNPWNNSPTDMQKRSPPPQTPGNWGAYSWAGKSVHTQRKFFRPENPGRFSRIMRAPVRPGRRRNSRTQIPDAIHAGGAARCRNPTQSPGRKNRRRSSDRRRVYVSACLLAPVLSLQPVCLGNTGQNGGIVLAQLTLQHV